jgi:hypothetical protein
MRIRPYFFEVGDYMSAQHEFYLERAAEARATADGATLDNVRERWLQAEASWIEMAGRKARSDGMRDKLLADKAAELAALETTDQN